METRSSGQRGAPDYGCEKYSNDFGETAGENEEAVNGNLLHGNRSAPGLYHGCGIKALDIDIVPEQDDDRRRRKKRSR